MQLVAWGVLGAGMRSASMMPLADTAQVAFGAAGGTLVLLALGLTASCPSRSVRSIRSGRRRRPPSCATSAARRARLVRRFRGLGAGRRLRQLGDASDLLSAALRLRAKEVVGTETPFMVPGGPTIPLLASAGIVVLLASLDDSDLLALGAVLAVCALP
jgi:hypothetical protein